MSGFRRFRPGFAVDDEPPPFVGKRQRTKVPHPVEKHHPAEMVMGVLDYPCIVALGDEIDRLPVGVDSADTNLRMPWHEAQNLGYRKAILPVVDQISVLGLDHGVGDHLLFRSAGPGLRRRGSKQQHLHPGTDLRRRDTARAGGVECGAERCNQIPQIASRKLLDIHRLSVRSERGVAKSNDIGFQLGASRRRKSTTALYPGITGRFPAIARNR